MRASRRRRAPAPRLEALDSQLRALLRETRRRAEVPTYEDVEEEADLIEAAQRSMEEWEAFLHEQDPVEDEYPAALDRFEEYLHLFRKAISALEDKLQSLGKEEPLPDEWEGAVRRLMNVLEGQQDLLLSFESLLHRILPFAPFALVESFEDLLHDLHSLLHWLIIFVDRQPVRRLVDRLCRRVETDAALVASAETLMKKDWPPGRRFAKSLTLLVSVHQSLVWSLIGVIRKVPDNRRLLTRLENRLHGLHALMESAADVIDAQLPDAPLANDFEEMVMAQQAMLGQFEQLVKERKPAPDRPLVRSFESLLRELASVLGRLETMVEAGPDHPQIKHLERRLEVHAELLESFEAIVAAVTREEFVESLQDLLVRFRRLIDRFAKLAMNDPGSDDEKDEAKKSLAGLRDAFKKLVRSVEDLKDKLPSLPPDLQEANEDLLAAVQDLDHEFLALVRAASPDADQFLAALADAQRLLLRFALLFSRRRRPSPRGVRRYRALVRGQGELVGEGHALVARIAAPSPFLLEALEDLDVLQKRLRQRVTELAALAP